MRASATTLQPELTPAELEAIVGLLRRHPGRLAHLEIGTAAGGTLREMMRAYDDGARPPFVVVDPFSYFPNQRQTVEANLRGAGLDPATVDFRVGFSWPMLKTALTEPTRFSFMFIDGNHKARYVMQDLAWTRLLEVGGHVCLHDYKPKFRGVIWATERFLRRYPNYERVRMVDSLVILRKTAPSRQPEVTSADIAIGAGLEALHRWRWSLDKRLGRAQRA